MIWQLIRLNGVDWRLGAIAILPLIFFAFFPELGVWMGLPCLLMLLPFTTERIGVLEATLPVHARIILASRLLVKCVAVVVPCLVWMWAVHRNADSSLMRLSLLSPLSLTRVAAIMCLVLLCLLLPFVLQPNGAIGPRLRRLIPVWLAVMIAGLWMISQVPDGVAIAVTSASAMAAWIVALRQAPASYVVNIELSNVVVSNRPALWTRLVRSDMNERRASWWWPLCRTLKFPLIAMTVFGLFSGLINFGVFYAILLGPVMFDMIDRGTTWMRGFPVPIRSYTRALALCTVVVPVLLMTAVATIKATLESSLDLGFPSPHALKAYDKIESRTQIPLAYWQRAKGQVPDASAPWGERSPSYTIRLIGRTYYNPYSTVVQNSDSFVAWQRARVYAAVYGQALPQQSGSAANMQLPLRTDSAYAVRILYSGAIATLLLSLLWFKEFARHYRFMRRSKWIHWDMLLLVPLVVVTWVQFSSNKFLPNAPDALLIRALYYLVQWLPASAACATALAFLTPLSVYFLYEWQAKRAELPLTVVQPKSVVTR